MESQHLSSFLPLSTLYSIETVVYLNIRVQQEGMNHDVLQKDLDGEESDGSSKYAPVETESSEPYVDKV